MLLLMHKAFRDKEFTSYLSVIRMVGTMLKNNLSSSSEIPVSSQVVVLQTFASLARSAAHYRSQVLLDALRLEYAHLRRDARAEIEKKIGMVVCLIEIIKICIIDSSANPGIVDSLLASTQGLLEEDDLPRSVSTSLNFYVAKHRLFLDDFEGAERELSIAYSNCAAVGGKNVERILFLLIPLRMAHGVFPTKSLLLNYPHLDRVYRPILRSIFSKNIKQFNFSIQPLQGVLFTLAHKLQRLVYREIVRAIWELSGKQRRIDLAVFQKIVPLADAMVFASLIRFGLVSGYVSYEEQALVLTGSNPFFSPASS